MTMTKTTTETAAAWADAQVRRHTHWPVDILGAGPRCTGNYKQGRALCVHPVECGVQHPVAEACTDIGAEPKPETDLAGPRMGLYLLIASAAVVVAGLLSIFY